MDYQAEIFDPTPGNAAKFVKAGKLAAFGSINSTGERRPAAEGRNGSRPEDAGGDAEPPALLGRAEGRSYL